MIEKVKKIRLPLWLKVVLAILAGGVYVWYCIRVFSVSEIDSDYANLVLEASDILKGNIFMCDWIQTGISFFTTDLLYYMVGVFFSGVSRDAYLIASGLMFSCMIFSALLLVVEGSGRKHKVTEILIFLGMCAVPSALGLNLLRAHTGAYVWAFIAVYCFNRIYKEEKCKTFFLVLFSFSLIMGCIGDAVMLVVAVVPMLLYCIRDYVSNCPHNCKKDVFLFLLTVASVVLGGILEKIYYFVGTANKNSFLETKVFDNFDSYLQKLSIYWHAVLGLNGADFTLQQLASFETIFYFIRTGIVLFGFIICIYNVVNFVKGKKLDIISEVLSLGFVLISIVFLITTVSVNINSARYIGAFPAILAVLVIRFLRYKKIFEMRFATNQAPVWGVPFVLGLALLCHSYIPIQQLQIVEAEQERIIPVLEEHNLKNGYANFWDSSINTVISNERVNVRAISMDDKVNIFAWGCKQTWYREKANFVLIRNIELSGTGVNYDNAVKLFGTPKEVVDFENYKILIYDYDISEKINWDGMSKFNM